MAWRRFFGSKDDPTDDTSTAGKPAPASGESPDAAAPADTEVPRDVFQHVVDRIAEPMTNRGWRYARSGPHLSRRVAPLKMKLSFASSRYNTAGNSVKVAVALLVDDDAHGDWRRSLDAPLRSNDTVLAGNIGNLNTGEARFLQWNVADPDARDAAVAEINDAIEQHALSVANDLERILVDDASPTLTDAEIETLIDIVGRLEPAIAVEYAYRFAGPDAAALLAQQRREEFNERQEAEFSDALARFRDTGLSGAASVQPPVQLAHLAISLELAGF